MSDTHDWPSDELLDELLAPFRAIKVPEEVRISKRHSVRVALPSCVRPVWWRRTVAIPVAIAIAATFAFAIAWKGRR